MTRSLVGILFGLILLATSIGCGGKGLAPVHGKVTADGNVVSSGTLVFSPIPTEENVDPGKSSTGDIQPDGTFQLSTHRAHDGGIVGRHRVRFIPSTDDKIRDSTGNSVVKYADRTLPSDFVVEVKSDQENDFEIALSKR